MSTLTKQAPRPRRSRAVPTYPRCLGLGALALVAAACGGSVDVPRGESGEGAGYSVTTSGTTSEPYTTTSNVGGSGGQGGYAGAGGTNWGGGLSGDMPDPYDGGPGGAGGSTGVGGAGVGGAADSGS